ncbi:dephospho-CoA kinase [Desulforamulus reducens MI-1]|uniref:Dephospho-CoA kinase n=1 Tax=Desulforamulus reducens (strain ATCC BAA-1160 / DSM 100696 / MI-1) TaxID=349161 RepID=A4J4X1_DESRM|nr:dephospho-CoA kinase [Desulforamulus reducens]ABO50124.1 dephospho-CoA kinase [Desulforamulus reducens MI-1]
MIIGLTGNIASGKSTVSHLLKELGAKVIDTDRVAREIVLPDTPALKEIVFSFGAGVLNNDGTLNRAKLATIVFDNPAARRKLEAITHPRIEEEINQQIEFFSKDNHASVLVLEVPLLIEVGWHKKVDQVWLVTVDERVQLERLMQRDKLSPEQAKKRIHSQMPQREKMKYANVIIDNSGTPEEVKQKLIVIWSNLINYLHD